MFCINRAARQLAASKQRSGSAGEPFYFRDPATDPACNEYGCAQGRECQSTSDCANGLTCLGQVCQVVNPWDMSASSDNNGKTQGSSKQRLWLWIGLGVLGGIIALSIIVLLILLARRR